MPRPLRIEFPGAFYHVVNRGNRGGNIFEDDEDRRRFLRVLGDAAAKTGWRAPAFCLLPDSFHLVLETPRANLVAGMKWLLGVYTWGFNRRHGIRGHLFAGRYRAVLIEESGGFLRAAGDYVHLSPARAGRLRPAAPLRGHPWSSLPACLDPAETRPPWLRVDRLLSGPGGRPPSSAQRRAYEASLEKLRQAGEPPEWRRLTRGWCFGSTAFKARMGKRLAGTAAPRHHGSLPAEAQEARAEALIAEELTALGWTETDLRNSPKMAPEKARIAVRLRQETVMTVAWMARRLHMGSLHTARNSLAQYRRTVSPDPSPDAEIPGVSPAATSSRLPRPRREPPAQPPEPPATEPPPPVSDEGFDVTWD